MNRLALCIAIVLSSVSASAQVTHWRAVKGPAVLQTADDTQPATAAGWSVCAFFLTQNPGDVTAVAISGGGIAGSIPFVLDGDEWVMEKDYATQGAMNAEFPSSTQYTIQASGGTLGTLTQQLGFGPEQYPNTPYLTGTVWTDVQNYDALSPFTVDRAHANPMMRR